MSAYLVMHMHHFCYISINPNPMSQLGVRMVIPVRNLARAGVEPILLEASITASFPQKTVYADPHNIAACSHACSIWSSKSCHFVLVCISCFSYHYYIVHMRSIAIWQAVTLSLGTLCVACYSCHPVSSSENGSIVDSQL